MGGGEYRDVNVEHDGTETDKETKTPIFHGPKANMGLLFLD